MNSHSSSSVQLSDQHGIVSDEAAVLSTDEAKGGETGCEETGEAIGIVTGMPQVADETSDDGTGVHFCKVT